MSTLLGLMHINEMSERAFAITTQAIDLLASHYTTWIYRFNIFKALKKNAYDELDWLETVSLENEKNYQIWNYRQLVIGDILKSGDYDYHREFPILAAMLDEDPKNHHVWTYRKWFVETFNLFDDPKENEFVEYMIERDVRNNSAWNHRFFIKFETIQELKVSDVVDSELEYVKHQIKLSPQNESSWNYLTGVCDKFNIGLETIEDFCRQFVNEPKQDTGDEIELIKSSFALEILAKIYNNQTSIRYYDLLSEKYDPIRKNYWQFLKLTISY